MISTQYNNISITQLTPLDLALKVSDALPNQVAETHHFCDHKDQTLYKRWEAENLDLEKLDNFIDSRNTFTKLRHNGFHEVFKSDGFKSLSNPLFKYTNEITKAVKDELDLTDTLIANNKEIVYEDLEPLMKNYSMMIEFYKSLSEHTQSAHKEFVSLQKELDPLNCVRDVANEVKYNPLLQLEVASALSKYVTYFAFFQSCILRKNLISCEASIFINDVISYFAARLRTDLSIQKKVQQLLSESITTSAAITLSMALVDGVKNNWCSCGLNFAASYALGKARDLFIPPPNYLLAQKVLDCLDEESPSGK
jgi:hypothetical protein